MNIISNFEQFMGKHGKLYSQFYIGIAKDINDRLKNGHNVDDTIPHIYTTNALPTDVVRGIEKHFLSKGCQGGPGGGDGSTRYAYAYLITSSTVQ